MNPKICFILGTRPEVIKMAPVIRECRRRKLNFFIIHTGQHYSYQMDKVFLEELEIPAIKYNLEVGSGSHGRQTGRMMEKIEKLLLREKPSLVLIQGDTNSVLAGALAAAKLQIKIGHIEAGLRSYDRRMPEEINRVIADHLADFLFAPTKKAQANLVKEGISKKKIFVVGNTIVDSVLQNLKLAQERSQVLEELSLKSKKYFLLTTHRAENVEQKQRMKGILKGINLVAEHYQRMIIWPIHPRTEEKIDLFRFQNLIKETAYFRIISPVGFLDFLTLQANARLVITDSGGIQEESCILGVPCVTVRETTERPESVRVGANILAGIKTEQIFSSVKQAMNRGNHWQNPFGDGQSGQRIIELLQASLA